MMLKGALTRDELCFLGLRFPPPSSLFTHPRGFFFSAGIPLLPLMSFRLLSMEGVGGEPLGMSDLSLCGEEVEFERALEGIGLVDGDALGGSLSASKV